MRGPQPGAVRRSLAANSASSSLCRSTSSTPSQESVSVPPLNSVYGWYRPRERLVPVEVRGEEGDGAVR